MDVYEKKSNAEIAAVVGFFSVLLLVVYNCRTLRPPRIGGITLHSFYSLRCFDCQQTF